VFTGLIEDVGRVKSVVSRGDSAKIEITTTLDLATLSVGGSIAVDGACLTITALKAGAGCFTADLGPETLAATTLGRGLAVGRAVNLERPLTLSRPLGGHLVTGHVDAVGTIRRRTVRGEFIDLVVEIPEALGSQVVNKGSIAVDGVSLTVTSALPGEVGLSLIPHTLRETTLPEKHPGAFVNIETDIIAKYVERSLGLKGGGAGDKGPGRVTESFLAEHGFLGKK
jgi:riboflavin synthase